jgi:hypothetical protein
MTKEKFIPEFEKLAETNSLIFLKNSEFIKTII